ncbi:hypothetical protein VKT23_017699, partial [Stygiomarasmius scandens]
DGASWVWGHERLVFEDKLRANQWKYWFQRYGRVFRLKSALGQPDVLAIGDPAAITHIYAKNSYNYWRAPTQRALVKRVSGRGMIWIEGAEAHRRQRSIVSPAFSDVSVGDMAPDMYHVANHLKSRITNTISESKSQSVVIDISHLITCASLDILGRTVFGYNFNAVGDAPDALRILDLWTEQNLQTMKLGFSCVCHSAVHSVVDRASFGPATSSERAGGRKTGEHGKDLVSLMFLANERSEPSKKLEEDEIYENVITFVVAGHETTSVATSHAIWELAKNQDLQDALRQEIMSLHSEPTYKQLKNAESLPLLDAVCRESIRLYPALPRTDKIAKGDDIIPLRHPIIGNDGSTITSIPVKAGQIIYVPVTAVNVDQETWDDADIFRPTRWLVDTPHSQKYCNHGEKGVKPTKELLGGWSGTLSFGEGPRLCIGMRLALLEWKVIMFTLIKHFKFSDTGDNISHRLGSTISPRIVGREDEGVQLPVRVTCISEMT